MEKIKETHDLSKNTVNDVIIIGASILKELLTGVDAYYAVHDSMMSLIGGEMLVGYSMLHFRSTKQKLNTKSSTESLLVVTIYCVPFNVWLVIFMIYQG